MAEYFLLEIGRKWGNTCLGIQCAQILISSCFSLLLAVIAGANGANGGREWHSLIPLLCFLLNLSQSPIGWTLVSRLLPPVFLSFLFF